MAVETLYDILNVDKKASPDEIKKAYRKLASKYHPDKGADSDEEKFKVICAAYGILSDPGKRERYDRGESAENIRKPEKTIEDQAIDRILSVFLGVVENSAEVKSKDLVKEISKFMGKAISQFESERKTQTTHKEKFERIISKIVRKDGQENENFFVSACRSQISASNREIEKLDKEILIVKKAIEIVNFYKYEFEPEPSRKSGFYSPFMDVDIDMSGIMAEIMKRRAENTRDK